MASLVITVLFGGVLAATGNGLTTAPGLALGILFLAYGFAERMTK